VQHQQSRRGRDAAADRQHLLIAAGEGTGRLIATLGEDWKQGEDALEIASPVAPTGLRIGAHLKIFHYRHRAKDLATFGNVCDAEVRTLGGSDGEQIPILEMDAAAARPQGAGSGL